MSAEMGTAVDPEVVNEAMERAEDELMDLYAALIPRNVSPTGMSYGSVAMDRGARIEAFLYRARSGALEMLEAISPPQFEAYVREFIEDVEHSPMYAQNPQMQQMRAVAAQQIGGR